MKKIILLVACIAGILLLSACQAELKCNKPYIIIGNACCLDRNNNDVCDFDDNQYYQGQFAPTNGACNKPYIKNGRDCCLDENENSICDYDDLTDITCEKPYFQYQKGSCCLDKNDDGACDWEEEGTECFKPYMKLGYTCCLDKDQNQICDSDENKESECPKFYIADQYGTCCFDKNEDKKCDSEE